MEEPLSTLAIAAVGGAAGKFVDKVFDLGGKWINTYFENHLEKSQKNAKKNIVPFLNELAIRLGHLEKNNKKMADQISSILEHPDFSITLQKAIVSASQTENKEKHSLLSRLIISRIQAGPESIISLSSKMACDAISFTRLNQLKLMGLLVGINHIKLIKTFPEQDYMEWLNQRFYQFMDLQISLLDIKHLEALACISFNYWTQGDLKKRLEEKNNGKFNYSNFQSTPLGKFLVHIWNFNYMKYCELTSTGQMIGIISFEQFTGVAPNTDFWDKLYK